MNSDSFVRTRVLIMNFYNQFVDLSISVRKCWSKIDILLFMKMHKVIEGIIQIMEN